jgi:hypothetical protein
MTGAPWGGIFPSFPGVLLSRRHGRFCVFHLMFTDLTLQDPCVSPTLLVTEEKWQEEEQRMPKMSRSKPLGTSPLP